MSDQLASTEDQLIESLAACPRGRKRNGTYAVWLFVRTCGGLLPPDRLTERGQQGRLAGLERRLRILSLPSPLKRALAGGLRELSLGTAHAAAIALQQLIAPARESVGSEVGDALAHAARAAREASREEKR